MAEKNMHGDHEATCFCCLNFYVGYEHDLSDITPGAGLEIHCMELKKAVKGPWLGESDERVDYHEAIHVAAICDKFKPAPIKES